MSKRKMVQCSSVVKKDAVRREVIDGVEHIIVSSYTLPDDVVMNGGLYPAEEIANSYKTLEGSLAPIEHPQNAEGQYISATDAYAIHNYHAGAFNVNVTQVDGRIHIEKHICVPEAMKSDRGKELVSRLEELETNENPRPIHTSTGLVLNAELLGEERVNSKGHKYNWIARKLLFNHDAILLNSVGAATPSQGVGMAVNADGVSIDVERIEATLPVETDQDAPMAQSQLNDQLQAAIVAMVPNDWVWIVDIVGDQVLFEVEDNKIFQVPFVVDNGKTQIVGVPIRVDKAVTYTPKVNIQEGDAMKDLIINALKARNIEVEGLTDDQLLAAHNESLAIQTSDDDSGDDLAKVVANALAPIADRMESLEASLTANADKDKEGLVAVIVNSNKFPSLDEEAAKCLPLDALKKMAANCGFGHGLPVTNSDEVATVAPSEMPA